MAQQTTEYAKTRRRKRHLDGERASLLTAEGDNQAEKASIWKDLFAGGVAGTAGIAIGHPFDTIKVRLQQQQQPSTPKIPSTRLDANSVIYRGLYRGIGAPLATAAVVNASVFCVYGATLRLWENHYPALATLENNSFSTTTIFKHLVCGAITGCTTSLVLCPIEYVKIRLQTMQLQPGTANTNSSFHFAKQVLYSRHGLQGLYRGFVATILRQTPSLAVYFPAYHILKESMNEFCNIGHKNSHTITTFSNTKDSVWFSSALAGGLAGCLSWTIVYPIDAIKSRIQSLPLDATAKERSFQRIARSISQKEGFTRLIFSRGLAVTLIRAFPVNGTIFLVYEFVNQQMQHLDAFGLGNGKKSPCMEGHHPTMTTKFRTKPRRRITLRVDDAIADVRDAS